MFELRNKTEVWYKAQQMIEWVLFGKIYYIEPSLGSENPNKRCVKKFDFDKEQYEIDTQITEYEYNGKTYNVKDGYFEVESEPIVPTPLTDTEQAIFDTAINNEYLVCLAELDL